ncbi:hypothetical protein SAMN05660866_02879 [Maribacter arcticus]|uniref:Uncharacterized protein n=1 Tax=Maribacter arcticus TaxID=561365 RepID=A0A1T5DFF6_9FLAO|nr:hypothetical protein SAMN05660866_02879 [Maribacter arcticus]
MVLVSFSFQKLNFIIVLDIQTCSEQYPNYKIYWNKLNDKTVAKPYGSYAY